MIKEFKKELELTIADQYVNGEIMLLTEPTWIETYEDFFGNVVKECAEGMSEVTKVDLVILNSQAKTNYYPVCDLESLIRTRNDVFRGLKLELEKRRKETGLNNADCKVIFDAFVAEELCNIDLCVGIVRRLFPSPDERMKRYQFEGNLTLYRNILESAGKIVPVGGDRTRDWNFMLKLTKIFIQFEVFKNVSTSQLMDLFHCEVSNIQFGNKILLTALMRNFNGIPRYEYIFASKTDFFNFLDNIGVTEYIKKHATTSSDQCKDFGKTLDDFFEKYDKSGVPTK